jgi:hypothetical protein
VLWLLRISFTSCGDTCPWTQFATISTKIAICGQIILLTLCGTLLSCEKQELYFIYTLANLMRGNASLPLIHLNSHYMENKFPGKMEFYCDGRRVAKK